MLSYLSKTLGGPLHRHHLIFASSGLALAILWLRFQLTGQWYFLFLVWNLFLAWIPWLLAQVITLRKLPQYLVLPLLGLWVVFFPNAPYILTDLFHLRPRAGIPLWFDLLMILSFAWAGLMWGYSSLRAIESHVFRKWHKRLGGWLSVAVLYLCAYGVYLGRYLRFNSWDLAHHPETILAEVMDTWLHPMAHLDTVGFTAGFGTFLVLTYGLYVASEKSDPQVSGHQQKN